MSGSRPHCLLPSEAEVPFIVAASLLSLAQQLLQENAVDAGQLCRVMLSISVLQPDPNILLARNRGMYDMVMSDLANCIPQTRSEYAAETLQFCFNLASRLNARVRDFVPYELILALDNIVFPGRIAVSAVLPPGLGPPLSSNWNTWEPKNPIPPPLR